MPIFDLLLGLRKDDPSEVLNKYKDAVEKYTQDGLCKQAIHGSEKYAQKIKKGLTQSDQNNQKWLEFMSEEQSVDLLFESISKVSFECRRTISSIILFLLQSPASQRIAIILESSDKYTKGLFKLYTERPDFSASCGPIIRYLLTFKPLLPKLITVDNIVTLLNCMSSDAFDAASDAFETIRV